MGLWAVVFPRYRNGIVCAIFSGGRSRCVNSPTSMAKVKSGTSGPGITPWVREQLSNRNWRELLGRYIFGLQETE